MYTSVPPQLWMQLDKDIREHLVKIFSLERTGITEILDQQIIKDGYSVEDLKGITLEKMIAYIGSEETFPRAWELTCSKAKYELHPPINITPMADEPVDVPEEIIETKPQTNGSSKKNKQN